MNEDQFQKLSGIMVERWHHEPLGDNEKKNLLSGPQNVSNESKAVTRGANI